MNNVHSTHHVRGSDASTFDIICVKCGHTDVVPGGFGKLTEPCKNKEVKPEEGEWK